LFDPGEALAIRRPDNGRHVGRRRQRLDSDGFLLSGEGGRAQQQEARESVHAIVIVAFGVWADAQPARRMQVAALLRNSRTHGIRVTSGNPKWRAPARARWACRWSA